MDDRSPGPRIRGVRPGDDRPLGRVGPDRRGRRRAVRRLGPGARRVRAAGQPAPPLRGRRPGRSTGSPTPSWPGPRRPRSSCPSSSSSWATRRGRPCWPTTPRSTPGSSAASWPGSAGRCPGHAVVDTLALARRTLAEAGQPQARLPGPAARPRPPRPAPGPGRQPAGPGPLARPRGRGDEAGRAARWPTRSSTPGARSPPRGAGDGSSEAIGRDQVVRIEYAGGTRGPGPREITPRRFSNRGGVAYLVALCHLDRKEKEFRLDRVRSFEVVERPDVSPGPRSEGAMAGLLVSVRSADEARAAVDGGASVVDVKEPDRGPLGRASAATWRAVRAAVPPAIPVSVALGELRDWDGDGPGRRPRGDRLPQARAGRGRAAAGESDWAEVRGVEPAGRRGWPSPTPTGRPPAPPTPTPSSTPRSRRRRLRRGPGRHLGQVEAEPARRLDALGRTGSTAPGESGRFVALAGGLDLRRDRPPRPAPPRPLRRPGRRCDGSDRRRRSPRRVADLARPSRLPPDRPERVRPLRSGHDRTWSRVAAPASLRYLERSRIRRAVP